MMVNVVNNVIEINTSMQELKSTKFSNVVITKRVAIRRDGGVKNH
jgi:hypothetical protein